jgi:hypothetical protein
MRGAAIAPVRCSCHKAHREFFCGWIAGGFLGATAIIEYLLLAMGVPWMRRAFTLYLHMYPLTFFQVQSIKVDLEK